jgi:tetratricopeptide (TPR) repeat protein
MGSKRVHAVAPGALALAALLLAAPAVAQEASGAVAVLLRQAETWLRQNRPDFAASSIERALAADPRNADALALSVRVEAARGNREAASAALARLRAAGATAEQVSGAEAALRAATLDRGGLEEARRLAREGRANEAAARYRTLFGGNPPEAFALEYFQTLAGSSQFAEEGRRGLARLAGEPGADPRARLANAQTLTFQPATRAEGIRRLQDLADRPDVGADARAAWRQALLWSLGDPAAEPFVEDYLRRFPQDADLRSRAQASARPPAAPPDPSAEIRRQGFERLEAGSARDAGAAFERAIAANPQDADSLGGLGLVRLREGRAAEARDLLERAIAADPASRPRWQRALDGAAYGIELNAGRAALRRGDVEQADDIARSAARRDVEDRTDAEQLLGDIALRRGDNAEAEQRFRAVLARRPGFAPAQQGLTAALRGQNRIAEVPRAVESAAPRPTRVAAPAAEPPALPPREATGLRAEAARATDPGVAVALLRGALSADPNDPYLRLDLARALRRQGRASEGRALVEELAGRDGGVDATFAAALFAEEDGRLADADAFLGRIPPTRRNADMQRLATRVRAQRDVQQAALGLRTGGVDGRNSLLTLAARPDPTGTTAVSVIRAFGDAGDNFGAAEASRVALAANRGAGAGARIAIAGALLAVGLEAEAVALANETEAAGNLTGEQRRDIASLRAGVAIRGSDRLNEAGNQAQAFETLRPVLVQNPQDPGANLALARLYEGARQPAEALRLAEAVLQRDPRSFEARAGAVQAAVALGDRRRAEQLLLEGQQAGLRDSRMTLLEARVARGFGDELRARELLEQAQRQRQAELGLPPLPPAGSPLPTLAGPLDNPFARTRPQQASAAPAALPQDSVARQIATELAQIQESTAPTGALLATGRIRSGSPGLDRLTELGGAAEGSVAAPGIGGRISARVQAVNIDSGRLGTDAGTLQRFGTNALGGAAAAPSVSASGVATTVSYSRGDWLNLAVGTSPIGFRETNILGRIEFAPRITDNLRLRVIGERTSVTDSVLSWAGVRDPRTNQFWGGVTRTGGRAQIEAPVGPGSFYAGGGWAQLTGPGVADNRRIEAGAGFAYPVIRRPDAELTAGLDLIFFGFERNLRGFTLGQGGYFSPQQFFGVSVPVDYRGRSGDLSWRVGGSVGYGTYREDSSPIFPTNPGLQAAAEARAATDPTVQARLPNQQRSGFIGGVRGEFEYRLSRDLSLVGAARYDKAPSFDETQVTLRLRNRF